VEVSVEGLLDGGDVLDECDATDTDLFAFFLVALGHGAVGCEAVLSLNLRCELRMWKVGGGEDGRW